MGVPFCAWENGRTKAPVGLILLSLAFLSTVQTPGCAPGDTAVLSSIIGPLTGPPSVEPNTPSVSEPNEANAVDPSSLIPCDSNCIIVGRPVSFRVTMQQGARVLFDAPVQISESDPLSFDQVNPVYYAIVPEYEYLPGRSNTSVYLSVQFPSPNEDLSNLYLSLRTGKQSDHRKKGNNPLVILNTTDRISITISEMVFRHNTHLTKVSVFGYPYGGRAAALRMMHYGEFDSSYYRLPGAILFEVSPTNKTLQVPEALFADRDEEYWLEEGSGDTPGISWQNIPSPPWDPRGGFPAMLVNGTDVLRDGEVCEIGVSAVVWTLNAPPRS